MRQTLRSGERVRVDGLNIVSNLYKSIAGHEVYLRHCQTFLMQVAFDVPYINTIPQHGIIFRGDNKKQYEIVSRVTRTAQGCVWYVVLAIGMIVGIVLTVYAAENLRYYVKLKTRNDLVFSQALSDQNMPAEILDKTYNTVAFATTHNSFAVIGVVGAANQWRGIKQSLESGVRALMLDVYFSDDRKSNLVLCHAECAVGAVEIEPVFIVIADFLDKYPRNVISILWETQQGLSVADQALLKDLLYVMTENSRLGTMLFRPSGSPIVWPTLLDMVQDGHNVVQFFDRGPYGKPWDLDYYQQIIETPFGAELKEDLDKPCRFNRGTPDYPGKLFLNNHFTFLGLSLPVLTESYNYNPYLYERVTRCEEELGKTTTNFVAVDQWSYSDVVRTVYCLNSKDTTKKMMCQRKNKFKTVQVVGIALVVGFSVVFCCLILFYKPRQTKLPDGEADPLIPSGAAVGLL